MESLKALGTAAALRGFLTCYRFHKTLVFTDRSFLDKVAGESGILSSLLRFWQLRHSLFLLSDVSMTDSFIHTLQIRLREFARERDWEQFHTPKNLAMALTVEAGELQEIFQWLSSEQSTELSGTRREHAGEELADVLLYLCRLADVLDIDLEDAALAKLKRNAEKYPTDRAKGNASKSTDYS